MTKMPEMLKRSPEVENFRIERLDQNGLPIEDKLIKCTSDSWFKNKRRSLDAKI